MKPHLYHCTLCGARSLSPTPPTHRRWIDGQFVEVDNLPACWNCGEAEVEYVGAFKVATTR